MPDESADYSYEAYPLQIGYCKLPNFQVKFNNFSGKNEELLNINLDAIVRDMIPSQIFIFPHEIDSLLNES
jgi:hypothetical protein